MIKLASSPQWKERRQFQPPAAPGLASSLIPSVLSAGQPLPERLPVLRTHPESSMNVSKCSRKQRKLESAGHRECSPQQAGGAPLPTLTGLPMRENRHAPIVQVGTLRLGRATAGLTACIRQVATSLPEAHLRKGPGCKTQGMSMTVGAQPSSGRSMSRGTGLGVLVTFYC